jgi:hypothetical protein
LDNNSNRDIPASASWHEKHFPSAFVRLGLALNFGFDIFDIVLDHSHPRGDHNDCHFLSTGIHRNFQETFNSNDSFHFNSVLADHLPVLLFLHRQFTSNRIA